MHTKLDNAVEPMIQMMKAHGYVMNIVEVLPQMIHKEGSVDRAFADAFRTGS